MEPTDWHFQIPLKKIYAKEGSLMIFENWLRKYGFLMTYGKDLGKIVENYAGNLM